jgi:hypothetical protein
LEDSNGTTLRCSSDSVCSTTKYSAVVQDDKRGQVWTPVPLRARFWIPLVTFMILLAVGLEIALHFSNVQQGMLCSLRHIFISN